jgi:BirA family biotin operon repressor/biotin-[acetyl-CoA-carboxylase] ligase
VRADRQTAGRGRGGHSWVSPPGSLYLSLILPAPADRPLTLLPLLVGVAAAECAQEWGVDARLKWPNDLLADDARKLGGILVESSSDGSGPPTIVAGVGVNLALDPRALPPDLRSRVTSVAALGQAAPSADEAAAAVLARVAVWYHAFVRDGGDAVRGAWRARAVDWWGREVVAGSGGAEVRGIARDVDERGALLLETAAGQRVAVMSGEVRQLRLASRPPGAGASETP